MIRKLLLIVLVLAMAAPLGACGRKGHLDTPPDSEYPRQYPAK
jgi:predicted small lipoprotein YifL